MNHRAFPLCLLALALLANFVPVQKVWAGERAAQVEGRRQELASEIVALEAKMAALHPDFEREQHRWEAEVLRQTGTTGSKVPARIRTILELEPSEREPAQREEVAAFFRPLSKTLGAISRQVAASRAALAAEGAGQPNVLFLFSDDQRADTIGALGNADIRTPALDGLVQRGTAFTRTYCMGSQQGAVCVPSRAMLMSGRTLFRADEQLKGQTTWPEQFAQAGYTTFMTGKWHNGGDSARRVFQRGKAVFLGGMGDPYKLPLQDLGAAHAFENKRVSGEHSVQVFADAAVEFLQEQKGAAPFLCYVAFNGPHDPRIAPQEFRARFDGHEPPVPGNFLPVHPFNNGEMTVRDEALAPWPRTPESVRQHLADYYASIEFMDAQIARILAALKAGGQWEKTIVVFASDHGLALGSHGLFGKQNLYDHSMRAPLLLAGPGIPEGRRSEALCYLLDIFPTLGALAGVPAPEGSEGRSLAPVLAGKVGTPRAAILTAYTKVQRAVRDDRWKLIVYPQINKTQLFDLAADPLERRDLAGDPAQAGEVQRMTALLRKEQEIAGDNQPLSSATPQPAEFAFPPRKGQEKTPSGEPEVAPVAGNGARQ